MTDHFTFASQGRHPFRAQSLGNNSTEEPASINRLNLVRTELNAKLLSIDETLLQSDNHKQQIYNIVKDIVNSPGDASAATK
jgi:hypothetical protein